MKRLLLAGLIMLAGCDSSPTLPEVIWAEAGTGNEVLDVPAHVERVTITGNYSGTSSNFIIWCNDDLLVNVIIGTTRTPTNYSGTHLLEDECAVMEIENSAGVAWTVVEVR